MGQRGRKKKLNADYFSHDNDMRNDPKLTSLRRKFGHISYSVWGMLLERLCDADYTRLIISEALWQDMASDFMIPGLFKWDANHPGLFKRIKIRRLKKLIYSYKSVSLIQIEENQITCDNLSDRIKPIILKRIKEREKYHQENPSENDDLIPATEIKLKNNSGGISAAEIALNKNKKQNIDSLVVNNNDHMVINSDSKLFDDLFVDYNKILDEELSIFINQFEALFGEGIKPGPVKSKMKNNKDWIIQEFADPQIFFKVMIKRMKDIKSSSKIIDPAATFIDGAFNKKYLSNPTITEENLQINYRNKEMNNKYPTKVKV